MISVSKNVYIGKLDDILCPGHMLLMILMEKKTVGKFYQNELQKTNQKSLELKK